MPRVQQGFQDEQKQADGDLQQGVREQATGKEAEMRVKSVSRVPGRFAVYDLEVPSTHNFAVNGGVIVHNSRMGLEPDIRKAYKPKQWSLPQGYERRYAATA